MLAEADQTPNAAVLIPASATDAETKAHLEELRRYVAQVFRSGRGQHDALFRSEIPTPEGFAADLADVLEEARNRILRMSRDRRPPAEQTRRDRPILRGP
jgi:FxsC-like protein